MAPRNNTAFLYQVLPLLFLCLFLYMTRSTIEVAHFRYFVSERRGFLIPKSSECQS